VQAGKRDLAKIEAASAKLVTCLIKAGVTAEQVQTALQ
jgi:hypothetical protein